MDKSKVKINASPHHFWMKAVFICLALARLFFKMQPAKGTTVQYIPQCFVIYSGPDMIWRVHGQILTVTTGLFFRKGNIATATIIATTKEPYM